MKSVLNNRQQWNKRGVELTINFIVTLILALAAFALGAVIIRTLTTGGAESITLTQDQLNQKISALSCSSRDKICISNNNKGVQPGDLAITGLAVYNYLSTPVNLDITVDPKRAYAIDGSVIDILHDQNMPEAMYVASTLQVEPRTQGQLAIGIKTNAKTPRGTYLFKVSVSDATGIFSTISDEISIIVK